MSQLKQEFGDLMQIIETLSDIEGVLTMQATDADINETLRQISDMFPEIQNLLVDRADKDYTEAIKANYAEYNSLEAGTDTYRKSLHKWVLLSKIGIAGTILSCLISNQKEMYAECRCADELFAASYMPKEIGALGLYVIGLHNRRDDAMYSYNIQLEAVNQYPEIAKIFGKTYVYEKDNIKEQISEKCPICGGTEAVPFLNAPQIAFLNEGDCFSPVKLWMKCCKCENLYAYNFPISEMGEINGHYAPRDGQIVIKPRHRLKSYSDIMNNCKGFTDGRKYLEVGVGNGEMLACALEHCFEAEAVEICKDDCETISAALSVPITWTDFLKFETDKKYDVIIMGDIIEHVSAPIDALKKAHSLMAPGGVLWISTPNYNSAYTRLMKYEDPMWNQKNHFTYFSYETMVPFFDAEGLEVVRYDISDRYNGSMELYLREKK